MRNHQIFIVLGMHRTATSLVAGGLKERGVFMGDDMIPTHQMNRKGFYESQRFMHLNCDILNSAGGDWNHPPSYEAIMEQAEPYAERIQKTLETAQKKAGKRSWGWKDPRTTLTYDLYKPYLSDYDVFPIACYRDPEQVGESLAKHHNMTVGEERSLTKIYNQRLRDILKSYEN